MVPNLNPSLASGRPNVKWKNTTIKAAMPRNASNSSYLFVGVLLFMYMVVIAQQVRSFASDDV